MTSRIFRYAGSRASSSRDELTTGFGGVWVSSGIGPHFTPNRLGDGRTLPAGADVTINFGGDVMQWEDVVGKARSRGLAGHTPYHGAGFVLDVDAAAFFAHGLGAEHAVGTHSGEDDGKRVGAEGGGDGAKENVDGGPAGIFRSVAVHREVDAGGSAFEHHVIVAGSDPGVAGFKFPARLAFVNGNCGILVESFGEHAGEERWHMLDDDNRNRKIDRDSGNDFGKRVGPAGRGADRQDFNVRSTAFGDGNFFGGQRRRDGRSLVGGTIPAQRLYFREQFLPDAQHGEVEAAGVAGFGDVVTRAQRQCIEGCGGAAFGKGAEHDDWQVRTQLADLFYGFEPGHVRHFNVKGDQVGAELRDLGEGKAPVRRGADDFYGGIGGQRFAQDSANHDGIINDEYANRRHGA